MTQKAFSQTLPKSAQKPLQKSGRQIFVAYPFGLYRDREAEYRAVFDRVGRLFNVRFIGNYPFKVGIDVDNRFSK